MDRAEHVHQQFLKRVGCEDLPHVDVPNDLPAEPSELAAIFEAQMMSRQLDRAGRALQARGEGFYTIGSSGHEGMAAVAAALRPTDLAFLHYRDAAFQIMRSKQVPGQTPLWDILLSFAASADDPISGGRHKVLGSKALNIPPQTSTIASHLPKAVGAAYGVGLSRRLAPEFPEAPQDSLVICSFGDASANHSTAQGAINTAGWTAYQGVPLPLLFVCEDNGIGISTPTPEGWIAERFRAQPGLKYMSCNGLDIAQTYAATRAAADYVRKYRKPVFLHMTCVRLYGHAGSDVQTAYLDKTDIERDEANDPLLYGASLMRGADIMSVDDIIGTYQSIGKRIELISEEVTTRPKLTDPQSVMESLVPPMRNLISDNGPDADERQALFADEARAIEQPQHMAKLLNWALTDLMLEVPSIVMAGEDIGPKGGVYNVTSKLHKRFGPNRVINTLLDEQSILGLSIGLAQTGYLPIPEIQFLAYLHNAEDQVRGEAATLSFFSKGQYTNPMIIRIAGLAYQRGFGGHFHNDNSLSVLRDIPGLIIACPSNGADAVQMMRECVRLAREEQRVIAFVEPIALYMMRDLHAEGDKAWTSLYPSPGDGDPIALGDIGQHGRGTDLAIVSYGNGYYLSRQAERILSKTHKVKCRVIDLRWLAPLNEEALLKAVAPCKSILIVDECRKTGSQSEALMALFTEHLKTGMGLARLTAEDSFIPLGRGATVTLPSRDSIVESALDLLKREPT
ncbi:MAG: thiamine pyrophosphate-dependent enzyme [Pseudomonadota bacterium]